MGAFMVSREHIDAVVTIAKMVGTRWPWDETELGRALIRENLASVNGRYPGYDWGVDVESYEFTFPKWLPAPIAAIKVVDCFEYQASEHRGWATSDIAALCKWLRGRLLQQLGLDEATYRDLPAWQAAPWGWDWDSVEPSDIVAAGGGQ